MSPQKNKSAPASPAAPARRRVVTELVIGQKTSTERQKERNQTIRCRVWTPLFTEVKSLCHLEITTVPELAPRGPCCNSDIRHLSLRPNVCLLPGLDRQRATRME